MALEPLNGVKIRGASRLMREAKTGEDHGGVVTAYVLGTEIGKTYKELQLRLKLIEDVPTKMQEPTKTEAAEKKKPEALSAGTYINMSASGNLKYFADNGYPLGVKYVFKRRANYEKNGFSCAYFTIEVDKADVLEGYEDVKPVNPLVSNEDKLNEIPF